MPIGFGKNLKDFTIKELTDKLETADPGSPVSNLVIAELTRRAIVSLENEVSSVGSSTDDVALQVSKLKSDLAKYNSSNEKYQIWLMILTIVIAILTTIMAVPIISGWLK